MTVEAKLRITPQLEAVVAGLRGLLGDVRNLESGVRQADSASGLNKMRAGLDSVSSKLQEIRTQVLAVLGLQQGAQGIAVLAQMSDQYQGMRARLRLVTEGQREFNDAVRTTQSLAARYNQPLAETTSLYTRLLGAIRPLGGGTREAAVATEAMLAALKLTGATGPEAASAILQFSQAMGSGVLRGEEFNAINEAAPRLLDAPGRWPGQAQERAEGAG
jgi:tape measure domain-containing protein